MDTHDRLDALLANSAPESLQVGDDLIRDMDRVAAASRLHENAKRPRVRRIPRVVAGVSLALLLSGGAGAAVAAGGFDWLPWAQDPDIAYTFTLPSGRECEERVVLEQMEQTGDWEAFVAAMGRLKVTEASVERWSAEIRSDPTAIVQVLNAEGDWEDPAAGVEPTEDDWYAVAHHVALSEAMNRVSAEAGVDGWWTSDAQSQCEAVTP
ncbi:hypothetical protein [Microbacterium sp. PMB16]|uniref:hypothetical protein n=1 Tax=Microbacterium sp. PMB16 TaxID=3120157 RepID=UPI003F4B16E2